MSEQGTQNGYNLRKRQKKSIFEYYDVGEEELQEDDESDRGWNRRKRVHRQDHDYNNKLDNDSDVFDPHEIVDRLPESRSELTGLLNTVKGKLKMYKQLFLKEQSQLKFKKSYVSENSIPVCADVTTFNFDQLIKKQLEVGQRLFDVIMMDPPWRLSTSQPSRGVAIAYQSLSDQSIEQLPINKLQKDGVLIIWAINAKYAFSVKLMEQWGYQIVDSITWVKKTVNGKIAKGHGYYLQHAKETCLVGVKGNLQRLKKGVARDVIFSDRRGQSQKPCEIYDYVEQLVPNGYYMQIFGRRNNLRDKWVTIGNEI